MSEFMCDYNGARDLIQSFFSDYGRLMVRLGIHTFLPFTQAAR